MNNDDTNEEFLHQLSSSYGQVESALGTEGYKEFLATRSAERQTYLAHAERTQAFATAIRIAMLIGMLMAMPVIVWLWKWAI